MTRINASIRPAELSNAMLFAEYKEIKRIPNTVKSGKAIVIKIFRHTYLMIGKKLKKRENY